MSSACESLVILLHGVGASGADLAPLSEVLRPFLPDAACVSPAAPNPFDADPSRRQWFSIVAVDDGNRVERVAAARAGFDRVVAHEIEKAGLGGRLGRVAFFGFSQGAIMALDALADGRWPAAAVVAASGRLVLAPGPKAAKATPVLLLHGDRDDVVPAAETPRAERLLKAAGFAVEAHVHPGLGHSVSYEGLQAAGKFLARLLGRPAG
ncbi:MAG: dienelactone hydrolase family protein [Hyphomicrobiales bacterium]|nr:dienelactone hydrolase family protein [Hyphomicrobiales bacterium]